MADFWLLRDYLPAADETDARLAVRLEELTRLVGADAEIRSVPVPHDCVDGFAAAFWRRPEAYLDPEVRAGMSLFATTEPAALAEGLQRLEADVRTGAWHRANADLVDADSLDVGSCTVAVDL